MARRPSRHPTELELEILKISWRQGPATVRQVRDQLNKLRPLAYTSVMTVMNIMVKKGYLQRSKQGVSYVYRARISRQASTRRMLSDLVDRVFDGSASAVMLNLLETADINQTDLQELHELIDRKTTEQLP
jgi:BlaI family penicillinase repressor